VEKEIIREVEIEKEIIKTVEVEVEIIKEVFIDKPIEVLKYVEVTGTKPDMQDA
jgi:hypothetical protein